MEEDGLIIFIFSLRWRRVKMEDSELEAVSRGFEDGDAACRIQ